MAGKMKRSERIKQLHTRIDDTLSGIIIGQKKFIDSIVITLLCSGHSIIVGVPGLAKTLTVNLLSRMLDMEFNRVQFTPDLMPSDITGTIVLRKNDEEGYYKFIKGPVFTNILLADEINRTPPKTQAALLQAMEERLVTAEGRHYTIEEPFNVFATQNPIEQEGTYPLPEAQLDRFMFQINVEYPGRDEEIKIISDRTIHEKIDIKENLITMGELLEMQTIVREMPAGTNIIRIIADIVRDTRPLTSRLENVREYIRWGASPRAGMYILAASKARAGIDGRLTPDKEDVRAVAPDVLRHRLILSFKGEMENVDKEEIIRDIISNSL
ncbi:MAG: MoxR family ATPase [candidate division WOR-3 bacterium]|nr:MoxR family ATPase [candidate division WOR-3 bacterium]